VNHILPYTFNRFSFLNNTKPYSKAAANKKYIFLSIGALGSAGSDGEYNGPVSFVT
jgi:hypothetical protein